MLEDSAKLYSDNSFYTMVFTYLIIRIMISLDLHYYQKNPDFSYLEFFPPPFYNFYPPFYFFFGIIQSHIFFSQLPNMSAPI